MVSSMLKLSEEVAIKSEAYKQFFKTLRAQILSVKTDIERVTKDFFKPHFQLNERGYRFS